MPGGELMNDQERIKDLKNLHKEIQTSIDEEYKRAIPDELLVNQLKRQKLRIKDELANLGAL